MDRKLRLIIDVGNSHAKVALTLWDEIVDFSHIEKCTIENIVEFLDRRKIGSAIYSSVTGTDARFVESLRQIIPFVIVLTPGIPLPLVLEYDDPLSLGTDRIADAVGANALFPDENIAVVDAGSALTLDVVSSSGRFLGGNISPGLSMRFRALNEFTCGLPRVTYGDRHVASSIGRSTEEAIKNGVLHGIAAEIESFGKIAARDFRCSRLLMTGGHAPVILEYMDVDTLTSEFLLNVSLQPRLLITGLNRILIYNETI